MAWRLLNRDGSFNIDRQGIRRSIWGDGYHFLLSAKWPHLLLLLLALYLTANIFFGTAYFLCGPGAIHGASLGPDLDRFFDCFFFSVQTLATIGFGHMSPSGIMSNLFVTLEAFVGMLGLALATGMVFARFSRPTARVLFSDKAILAHHDGVPSFLFRMANKRLNQITEAQVNLVLGKKETTAEGESYRGLYDLKLERSKSPFFAMTWTIVHPIDDSSPLKGMTHEDFVKQEVEILASLTGIDGTFSQTIHTRFSYAVDDFVWDVQFEDMLSRSPDGRIRVDLTKLNEFRKSQ